LPPPVRRPPPPAQLRVALAYLRCEGYLFDDAWPLALKRVVWPHDTTHRRQWREALRATRPEWEACYAGLETRTGMFFRDFPPGLLEREDLATHDLPRAA
jgi:hypothetical protein